MAKIRKKYICRECGATPSSKTGKCFECGTWGAIEEQVEEVISSLTVKEVCRKGVDTSKKLNTVKANEIERIVTGINEFDRVLGGGIVVDSVNILSAVPGAGKSTLLTKVSQVVAEKGFKVLYASGEESETQIKNRADRIIGEKIHDNINVISGSKLENVIEAIEKNDADLIVIDSIQSFGLDHITSRIGSPTQIMECAKAITTIAKESSRKRAVIMISQVTKEDEVKGPRELEHLVDAIMILEGEYEVKSLVSKKNRFGEIEVGMFEMGSEGLKEISNPSRYFITEREDGDEVCGSAITVVREGSRYILMEVESSVSKSYTPYPSRLSEGIRKDQLSVLISILEEKGGINLYDKNVITKITAGLKTNETSMNLAILMSIVSSHKKVSLGNSRIFVGEVGLTGEVKKVSSIEGRIKEADRMGFKEIIVPKQPINLKESDLSIKITKVKNLKECISKVGL